MVLIAVRQNVAGRSLDGFFFWGGGFEYVEIIDPNWAALRLSYYQLVSETESGISWHVTGLMSNQTKLGTLEVVRPKFVKHMVFGS